LHDVERSSRCQCLSDVFEDDELVNSFSGTLCIEQSRHIIHVLEEADSLLFFIQSFEDLEDVASRLLVHYYVHALESRVR